MHPTATFRVDSHWFTRGQHSPSLQDRRRLSALVLAILTIVAGSALAANPARAAGPSDSATHRIAAASVVAGDWVTCAITAASALRCWGENASGELGQGNVNNIGDNEPITIANSTVPLVGTPVSVSHGTTHTCALTDTGTVQCWGYGGYGRTGQGNTLTIGNDEPVTAANSIVPLGEPVIGLSAGATHTCAVTVSGALRCWGDNANGQLGLGHVNYIGDDEALTPENSTVPLGETAVAVALGNAYTCVLTGAGKVRCWGSGASGRTGLGMTNQIGDDEDITAANTTVPLAGRAVALSAGRAHTCAVIVDGTVQCWGYGGDGRHGLGHANSIGDNETLTVGNSRVPIPEKVIAVSAGNLNTCVLTVGGAIRCWGANGEGQLGLGNTQALGDDEPVASVGPIGLGGKAIAVSSGNEHACATMETGVLRCWGRNNAGQLGQGNTMVIGDNEFLTSANSTVPLGSPVRTRAAVTVTASASPARDRSRPYRYTVAGVIGGLGLVDEATCAAPVTLTAKGKVKVAPTKKQRTAINKRLGKKKVKGYTATRYKALVRKNRAKLANSSKSAAAKSRAKLRKQAKKWATKKATAWGKKRATRALKRTLAVSGTVTVAPVRQGLTCRYSAQVTVRPKAPTNAELKVAYALAKKRVSGTVSATAAVPATGNHTAASKKLSLRLG